MPDIVTIHNKKNEKFLRTKTEYVDIKKLGKEHVRVIVRDMKRAMKEANGIGLSANQIGLPYRMFVGRIGEKSYTIINPEISVRSQDEEIAEEGCLSIPGKWGAVSRSKEITIVGIDHNGKKIKIKAWGLLARMFQHEVDHLDGKLFIDRATSIIDVPIQKK